jgi:hypothetical protein
VTVCFIAASMTSLLFKKPFNKPCSDNGRASDSVEHRRPALSLCLPARRTARRCRAVIRIEWAWSKHCIRSKLIMIGEYVEQRGGLQPDPMTSWQCCGRGSAITRSLTEGGTHRHTQAWP